MYMAATAQPLSEPSGRARRAPAGPAAGLLVQVLLLAGLAATVGLGAAGWVAGLACAIVVDTALAIGLSRHRCEGLGAANRVTLARGSLAIAAAALVADSFTR